MPGGRSYRRRLPRRRLFIVTIARRNARCLALLAAGALTLAACETDPEPDPGDGTTGTEDDLGEEDLGDDPAELEDDADEPTAGGDAEDTPEQGYEDADAREGEEPDAGTDGGALDDGADHVADDDGTDDTVPALEAQATTDESEDDGDPQGVLAVSEVRVGAHDGFDRVTFELVGDATAGWFVSYPQEATSQGSGEPIEVAGEEVIAVSLRNVSYPPELPDDVPAWDGEERIGAPEDAAVLDEVVADTIFEGIHLFYLGVEGEEVEHRVARLDEPQRVVIDLAHP